MAKKRNSPSIGLHVAFIIITALFIVPLIIAIMISFSTESDVLKYGYSIIPKHFTLEAYKTAFGDSTALVRAYGITILTSFLNSSLTVILTGVMSYPLAREEFTPRKYIMIYVLITMLFGGGLIPTYILNTQYLHLGNTIWIYIVTGLISGSNIILFKTSFSQIPKSLMEAAEIDGATQLQVCAHVVIPTCKPIIAMIFFNTFLGHWNDYTTSMYYISDSRLYSLQYFLNRIITNSEFVKATYKMFDLTMTEDVPLQTLRFAVCVLGAMPVLILFPMIQKYFSKGITSGSVKG